MGFEGLHGVKAKLAQLFERAPGAVGAALYQEGLRIDAQAVSMTPVDTGRLRATHYVGPPEIVGSRIEVPVGFGTDYAVYVHERTDVGPRNGGEGPRKLVKGAAQALYGGEGGTTTGAVGPKFLERALHASVPGFEERLARRARKNIRDGVTAAPIDGSVPTTPTDIGPIFGPGRKQFGAQKRRNRREEHRARKRHAKAVRALEKKQKKAAKREARRDAARAKREAAKARKAAARAEKRAAKRQAKAAAKLNRARNRVNPKRFDF